MHLVLHDLDPLRIDFAQSTMSDDMEDDDHSAHKRPRLSIQTPLSFHSSQSWQRHVVQIAGGVTKHVDANDRVYQDPRSSRSSTPLSTERDQRRRRISPQLQHTHNQRQLALRGHADDGLRSALDAYTSAIRSSAARFTPAAVSPATMLDTSLFDPFMSTAVPLDRNKAFLLRFFFDAVVPQLHWIPSFSTEHNRYIIGSSVGNPLLLYAVLCRTAVEFAAGGGKLPDRVIECATSIDGNAAQTIINDFADFRGQLQRQLKDKLGTPGSVVESNTMSAMALFIRSETINGTVESVSQNILTLWRASEVNIGMYPPEVLIPVMTSLYLGCATSRQVPPFMPPTKSATAILPFNVFDISPASLRPLCSGFRDPAWIRLVGESIGNCVPRLHQAILFKHLCSTGYATASLSEYAMVTNLQQSAEYDLLLLPTRETLTSAQETSRLAILIATMTTNIAFDADFTYTRSLSKQLRKSLGTGLDTMRRTGSQPVCPTHLIWCLFIGAFISRNAAERSWFVFRLGKASAAADVTTLNQMKESLANYIYFESLHGGALADIWEEIELIAETLNIGIPGNS